MIEIDKDVLIDIINSLYSLSDEVDRLREHLGQEILELKEICPEVKKEFP